MRSRSEIHQLLNELRLVAQHGANRLNYAVDTMGEEPLYDPQFSKPKKFHLVGIPHKHVPPKEFANTQHG